MTLVCFDARHFDNIWRFMGDRSPSEKRIDVLTDGARTFSNGVFGSQEYILVSEEAAVEIIMLSKHALTQFPYSFMRKHKGREGIRVTDGDRSVVAREVTPFARPLERMETEA